MKNYLLNCDLQEKIWEKLIQIRAVVLLINETTDPHCDNSNNNVNTCTWMIAEQLDEILGSLENLSASKGDDNE